MKGKQLNETFIKFASMNKNELVTVINVKDGRKKHLIAALAYNDAYLERHGFKRVEAPAPVAEVKVAPVSVEASKPVAKVRATPTPKTEPTPTPKTEPINPFANI